MTAAFSSALFSADQPLNHIGSIMANPLAAKQSDALCGTVTVPGDKSISHRALIFGALSTGTTNIRGLLEGEDVINTAKALTALGAPAQKAGDVWQIRGAGPGGLTQPVPDTLDFGNSGTGVRLMLGVLAGHDVTVTCVGDASLSRRPMGRVTIPLKQMGLIIDDARDTLPMTITGTSQLIPIEYTLPVPSAQVKSAILIAGLHARGTTSVIETEATRDHTERMLRYFGANVETRREGEKTRITVHGHPEMSGRDIMVPGDPSSAAFLAAAAAIVPGSDVTIRNILYNHTRTGFYQCLQEMGANLTIENQREEGGEPIADLRLQSSELKGITVPPDRAPSMIDEYPILAVVAAFASGETIMQGLGELKVKESDRLAATAAGLIANGVEAIISGTTLIVRGGSQNVPGGGTVTTHLDHRIAMAFLILGQGAKAPVTVDDGDVIATSFPEFRALMQDIGGNIGPVEEASQ